MMHPICIVSRNRDTSLMQQLQDCIKCYYSTGRLCYSQLFGAQSISYCPCPSENSLPVIISTSVNPVEVTKASRPNANTNQDAQLLR